MPKLDIKKFNVATMGKNKTVLVIGKRGSGKSFLLRDIMYHKRDVPLGLVFSPTEEVNQFFGKFIPRLFIHHQYDPAVMQGLEKRQTKLIRGIEKNKLPADIDARAFIILDDCMADAKEWKNDKYVRRCLFNWRHLQCDLACITLQSPVGTVGPEMRDQFDYVFLFYTPSMIQQEKLYKYYASMFPTKQMFYKAFSVLTENHGCLVIKNTGAQSNKLEDIVYWYRAEMHDDFKVGHPEIWKYNETYLRQEEEEEEEDMDTSLEFYNKLNEKNGGNVQINPLPAPDDNSSGEGSSSSDSSSKKNRRHKHRNKHRNKY